jgi:hypothetical protein
MLQNARRRAAAKTAQMPVLRVDEGERAALTWAEFVRANHDVFAEQLGWPIGKRLGCGFYGCVFQSDDPWVVKFTRDPSEGPTWAYIAELQRDPEIASDMGGFLRVNDVARIRPDVIWEQAGEEPQQMPVYAIQRESATPLFIMEAADMFITRRTAKELQLTAAQIKKAGWHPSDLSKDGMPMYVMLLDLTSTGSTVPNSVKLRISDLAMCVTALDRYRIHAEAYWRSQRFWTVAEDPDDKDHFASLMSSQAMKVLSAAKAIAERPDGSPSMFGHVIGTTLYEAFDKADMVVADLHRFNVGWRDHAEAHDTKLPLTLTVVDPGVALTPWEPEIREIDLGKGMLERNGIDVEAHIAGLRRNPEYESYWCTFCGGSAHPATGSVYGDRTIACRRCEQELWEWAQRHTHKRRRGAPSFYDAAVRGSEALGPKPSSRP